MPRMMAGGGELMIRLALFGCTNRPFYHIVVMHQKKARNRQPMEQIGSYDPMPNAYNEKLVAVNFERLNYWLACGANPSKPVSQLLGLAGYLPLYPMSYIEAKRNRVLAEAEAERKRQETEEVETVAET